MKLAETLRSLAGACTVYAAMAACSGASDSFTISNAAPNASDAGSSAGGDSASGSGSGSGSGGELDATSVTDGDGASTSGDDGPVPSADASEVQSGSRLKATYYVGSDGSKQFASWSDSARGGEQCGFQPAGDGVIRCLPSGVLASPNQAFSDSGCTKPLAFISTNCKGMPLPVYVETFEQTTCPSTLKIHLYSSATLFTGANIFIGSPANCLSSSPGGGTYATLGAEIPPASFQQATLVTDP